MYNQKWLYNKQHIWRYIMIQAIIKLSWEKDGDELLSMIDENEWVWMDDFIFSEYKVKVVDKNDMWTILKVKRYPDHHMVDMYCKYNYTFTFKIPHMKDEFYYVITAESARAKECISEMSDNLDTLAKTFSVLLVNLEKHIMTKAKERKIKTITSEVVKDHSGKPSKETLSTSRSQTLNLSLEDTIKYVSEYNTTRQYTKHVESFNVRGHYRHYKNGKVVFVKAFVKGDKNKTPKTRTYEM